jgi:hypothetical protein
MVCRAIGKIAQLKGNATIDSIVRWRDINAYEVSAAELFATGNT